MTDLAKTSEQTRDEASDRTWLRQRERGSQLGIAFVLAVCRVLGRRGGRFWLPFIAFYYAAFGGRAIAASQQYLEVVGARAGFWGRYRHVLTFTQVVLDRFFFAQGKYDYFDVELHGHEHLAQLAAEKRGAILLGAHLGSFDAMRAMSVAKDVRINVLVHFENARKISAFLRAVAPQYMDRVIEIPRDDPSFIFRVQEKIEAGELVAVLGDRIGLGEKSVSAPFFGREARFPVGAFTLAAALRCPVYLTFGLHHPPRRYDLYCEPFEDRVTLPRGQRQQALRVLVHRFADRLEHHCRLAPYNWFNFYDFWDHGDDAPQDP